VVVLVYRARDSHLSRAVAVKVFSEHLSAGSGLPPALRARRAAISGNIMLTKSEAKLLDFGLAKLLVDSPVLASALTATLRYE
jgi:serine/threonine protein kinase